MIFLQLGGCKAVFADKECIEMHYRGIDAPHNTPLGLLLVQRFGGTTNGIL